MEETAGKVEADDDAEAAEEERGGCGVIEIEDDREVDLVGVDNKRTEGGRGGTK